MKRKIRNFRKIPRKSILPLKLAASNRSGNYGKIKRSEISPAKRFGGTLYSGPQKSVSAAKISRKKNLPVFRNRLFPAGKSFPQRQSPSNSPKYRSYTHYPPGFPQVYTVLVFGIPRYFLHIFPGIQFSKIFDKNVFSPCFNEKSASMKFS